ncbi:terpene synthase 10-like isoform X2 [Zingiber officinale]|uniref:terpene synthase 10-like isoform X2 n=1 Tax=Zingiber officinale TaxID=94328 RepID=UPI001C4DCF0C|nr:terpene synthase 10-like isoform X2 [Zingiber officinale]
MSLYLHAAPLLHSPSVRQLPALRPSTTTLTCRAAAGPSPESRRSANYQPSLWTDDHIQALTANSPAVEEQQQQQPQRSRMRLLKERIRKVMWEEKEVEEQLRLIDQLQQLGVAYHFRKDIADSLTALHASLEDLSWKFGDSLHASALLFRLLRQNNLSISQDIFDKFRDERGHFTECLKSDVEGMLALYEASYFAKEEEEVLHEATEFTIEHLKGLLESSRLVDGMVREKVGHALELPLNWRMERWHTKWFIGVCQREAMSINPNLLEFAILDFNALQSIYKKELGAVSRWWTELGLAEKLPFSRDRLAESYLWTVGWAFEPQYWSFREAQTKGVCFVTMIDDVYDVYGTLDELQLFTHLIDRWDVNAIDELPDYMKILFLAIFNTVNDAAYEIMKHKGFNVLPYLKRAWVDLCKAYLVEAKWYHSGYTPTLDEYLDNAWMSISVHVTLTSAYCMAEESTQRELSGFSYYPAIAKPSCTLARLYDDIATSSAEIERGDVPKSIQCCMHERGVSEAVARRQIKELIKANWRCINRDYDATTTSLEGHLKRVAINVARTFQFFYQHGDGYGEDHGETKNQLMSLLMNPIVV